MIGKEKDYPKFIAEGEARMSGKKLPAAPVRQPAAQPVYNTAAGAPQLSMNGASGSSVTISGRGSGHGVGMPQWTAKALAEAGVVSPLRRAGMTKANVRHVLASLEERFGLPSGALMSAKPSFPCLAVYVPQGESITEASLREAARSRGL